MDNEILNNLKNHRINPATLEGLDEDEKKYFYLNAGMLYVSGLNAVDRTIREEESIIRTLVPEPIEDLKILISRTADIKPDEIQSLSAGFLVNLFTVNGRVLKVTMPEVGEVDEVEFKRFVVEQIKSIDEEVATANEVKKEIINLLKEDIPEDCIKLLSDISGMDEWMMGYLKKMASREDISDADREDFNKKLEAREASYTLAPLKESIQETISKKSNTDSIIHAFRFDNERFLAAAVKACSANNITFPFQLFVNIQEKLFGDKYINYKNLFLFIWARFLKYKGPNFSVKDKIFITNFHTHIVLLKRSDEWKKIPRMVTLKESIEEVLDLVIKYKSPEKKK